jgi:hypothetical protein
VPGIDDFALRRGLACATVLIDAETGRRAGVLPGRTAGVAGEWLRDHPGVEIMCRDGPGAYGEAVRRALPGAVQVSDRWHLWHGLAEAVRKEVAAHSACWAGAAPLQAGPRAETTLERWRQVHDLLGRGAGLLECARRLDLALNTVKRYARADRPERLQRTPQYRPTLVDPYRDHLRKRRAGYAGPRPDQQMGPGPGIRAPQGDSGEAPVHDHEHSRSRGSEFDRQLRLAAAGPVHCRIDLCVSSVTRPRSGPLRPAAARNRGRLSPAAQVLLSC